MAVNVQDHQTLSIEKHPKLRPIKSHPYLNTYSTPPLPKPLHFHQLSDQTGQSSHQNKPSHHHQLSTISLPSQLAIKTNGHETNFKPILNQACLNENIEQYEMTFSYSDLEKRKDLNQQIYINHPILNRPTDLSDSVKNSIVANINGQFCKNNELDSNFKFLNGHDPSQERTYQNFQIDSPNRIENLQIENHKTSSNQSENLIQTTYHGLPQKFVKALKKLFDVFDTNKCGFIRILDIENRIKDEEFDEELDRPQDLIDSLRKVTSPNGLINFSNFCAAINICLLKNQLAKSRQQQDFKTSIPFKPKSDRNDSYLKAQNIDKNLDKNPFSSNANQNLDEYLTNGHSNGHFRKSNYHHQKYSQQSSLNSNSPLENSSFTSTSSSNSSTKQLHKDFNKLNIKSNQNSQMLNNKLKYRPSSVPVEFNGEETDYYKRNLQPNLINKKLDNKAKSMGSLKEQIYANKLRLCSSESRLQQNTVISSQAIMQKLFEWRNNLLERKLRLMNGTMNDHTNGTNQFNQHPPSHFNGQSNSQLSHLYSIVNKKKTTHRKIDETRRHTVTSLHSLNSSKKLFNMQKEKDLLQQGLVIIERVKKFYLRQIEIVQNQIDHLNQCTKDGNNFFINQLNTDYNIKQHLDELNTLEQINRNLVFLVDNQFSQTNRFNNVQPEIEIQKQNLMIFKLKEQVQMLNDELIRKSNIILNLERSNPFIKTNLNSNDENLFN